MVAQFEEVRFCGESWSASASPGYQVIAKVTVPSQRPDLSLKNKVSPSPVVSGNTLTYTITVTNTGGEIAEEVRLEDLIPESAVFSGAGPRTGPARWMTPTGTRRVGGDGGRSGGGRPPTRQSGARATIPGPAPRRASVLTGAARRKWGAGRRTAGPHSSRAARSRGRGGPSHKVASPGLCLFRARSRGASTTWACGHHDRHGHRRAWTLLSERRCGLARLRRVVIASLPSGNKTRRLSLPARTVQGSSLPSSTHGGAGKQPSLRTADHG